MSIVWEQRIRHFDRPVKLHHHPYLKAGQRRSMSREIRGLPSRNWPSALVIESLRITARRGTASQEESERCQMRLEYELLRSRLLERKRHERAMIRHRKVTADRTCINLWKRRRAWLNMVEDAGDCE
jgi:hypothetical protein